MILEKERTLIIERFMVIKDGVLRAKLARGMDKLADAVKVTLGPRGRNVLIQQKKENSETGGTENFSDNSPLFITNSGSVITESIVLSDPWENMGVQILKEAAAKTNKEAGDGSTTAIVLTQALIRESMRCVCAGISPIGIRRGMNKAAETAVASLQTQAVVIQDPENISQAAAVSCQEPELGKLIGEALVKIGPEGVMNVRDSKRLETTLEIAEGIVFERGMREPYMATDLKSMTAELYEPFILFCDTKFTRAQDIVPALIMAAEAEHSLLIVSEGVEGEALGVVAQNKIKGDIDVVCVQAPLYGEGRRWRMEDMALQTGGIYVTRELCPDIRGISNAMLGTAKYVKITKSRTCIVGPGGDPGKIEKRIQELRYYVEHTEYEFNARRHRERLASFVSGIATLHVGGTTEIEIQERMRKAENAVHAAIAACKEGIVPGGGVAFLNTLSSLEELRKRVEGEEKSGVDIVMRALEVPVRQIAENAGDDGNTVVTVVKTAADGTGYNAESGKYENMIRAGIVDPLTVAKAVLQISVSAATTFITTEAGVLQTKGGGK